MEKVTKKYDRYIFCYGELVNIAAALYFGRVVSRTFFVVYIAMLLLLLVLKNTMLRPQEKYADKTSLVGMSLIVMEFSILFLVYTKQSVLKETAVMLTACVVIYMIFKDHDFGHCRFWLVSVLFIAALAVSVKLRKNTWTIELTKLLFVWSSLLLLDSRRVLLIFLPLAVCSGMMMIFAKEFGTVMVLSLAAVLMCILSKDRAAVITGIVLCAAGLGIWLLIYDSDIVFSRVSDLAGSDHRVSLQRLFFKYEDDDQLVLINKMITDRNDLSAVFSPCSDISLKRRGLELGRYILSVMISPPAYTELVSAASSSTAAADYMYSIMCYVSPVYSFIITSMFIHALFRSVNRNIGSELKLIPLILLAQSMVHILSNLMLFPYTGIPMPFLSHGPASLAVNVCMLCMLSNRENNEER